MSTGTVTPTSNNETETPDVEFAQVLEEHIRAGYQMLYVQTAEESRVEVEINRVAARLGTDVVTWDCYDGFSLVAMRNDPKNKNPIYALESLVDDKLMPEGDKQHNHIFVFRDLDDYMTDSNVRRRLKTLAEGNKLVNKRKKRPVIIVSPTLNIHPKLRAVITVIDFALPTEAKLLRQVEFVRQSVETKNPDRAKLDKDLAGLIAVNLLGLTSNEAENCLSRCLVKHSGFTPDMLGTIKEEKAAIVKKSEVLTYIPEGSCRSRDDIGGYDLFMSWLDMRRRAYSAEAKAANIDYPKGVVLLGLPGTGKSMVAKAACMILGLPGYILDIGSLFGSLVGESEQRTRDVLKQIDAQKGCVLLIDEADKALGNAHSSTGDSGVTRRVFGTILTWLAENNSRTFCIMTVNRTDGLPPELMRAGRFDAVFYTDLPNTLERRQIMEIHLRRRKVEPTTLKMLDGDWAELVRKTEGFVGSELEEVIREARYRTFAETGKGQPEFVHLMEAAASIVPMTKRDPEGMQAIREFCADKAKPVTSQQPQATVTRKRNARDIALPE